MSRYGGIPLGSDRATFEAYESRVEARALSEYQTYPGEEPCGRCDQSGSEPGSVGPCEACLGRGWL